MFDLWGKKVQEKVKDFFGIRSPSKEAYRTRPRSMEDFVNNYRAPEPEPSPEIIPPLAPEKEKKTAPSRSTGKEFLRIFKQLTEQHHPWDIWKDFIVMFACAISNAVDKAEYDKREERYMSIIKRYDKDDQMRFPELVAAVVMALDENQEQDFLGRLCMELELGNDAKAQIFTPYSICRMMAEISVGDVCEEVDIKGCITIHDPCCGAGATLIAGVHEAKRQLEVFDLDYRQHVFVAAQDIDETVALMCYIQLSLLGVAGYVKVGNSLTEPMTTLDSFENYWFTPMCFSEAWTTRRMIRSIDDILKGARNEKNFSD